MLENPYYTAQPDIPYDAGAYLGQGRIEESPDGSSIVVRWESTLEDGIAVQLRFQEKLGVAKSNRRIVLILLGLAVVCFLFAVLNYFSSTGIAIACVLVGVFICILALLRLLLYRRVIRRVAIRLRGTTGTVDSKFTLDATGVHSEWENLLSTFRWAGLREIETNKQSVIFVREPAMILYVPVRVFPDAATLERFVRLGLKYTKR